MSIEHLPNRDAIYDLIESDSIVQMGGAMIWAHKTAHPELSELWQALRDNAWRHPDSEVGRATAVILDAWIAKQQEKAAEMEVIYG